DDGSDDCTRSISTGLRTSKPSSSNTDMTSLRTTSWMSVPESDSRRMSSIPCRRHWPVDFHATRSGRRREWSRWQVHQCKFVAYALSHDRLYAMGGENLCSRMRHAAPREDQGPPPRCIG